MSRMKRMKRRPPLALSRRYRYGGSLRDAARALYADGGARRFYRGLLPALAQGPLSRFGDTAANAGARARARGARRDARARGRGRS